MKTKNDLVESGSATCRTPEKTSSPLHSITPTISGTKIKEEQHQKHQQYLQQQQQQHNQRHHSMTVSVTTDNHHQNTITTTTSVVTATTTVKSAMISLAMRRPSSPGNSSGSSDNDTINNSSAATALRRLYFKSGRSAKTKPQPTTVAVTQASTVPKVVIMGTSTTSATDINTSTESASTLITNVTATDTSETNDSLDMGDTSGQSEPLLSSLDEPNQTSTSMGSDQEITELELTSVYSKADVSVLDNLEEESSLTIQHQQTSAIPRTAPSISSSSIHFPFDPPQSPRSVKTIQKNESLFTFKDAASFLEQHKKQQNQKEQVQDEDRNNLTNKKYKKLPAQNKFLEEQQPHHHHNLHQHQNHQQQQQQPQQQHQQQHHYQKHIEQLQIQQQHQQQQQRKLSTSSCYSYKNVDDRRPSTKSVSSLWNWNFEHDKENKKRKESCCSAKYSTSSTSSNERPSKNEHEIICDLNNFNNGMDDVKKQRKDNNAKLQAKSGNKFSDKLIKTSPNKQQDKYGTRYSSKINSAPAVTTINRKDKICSSGGIITTGIGGIGNYNGSSNQNYDQKDLTMFPFDKEALDYQRIQRECFAITDEYNDYNNETNNKLSTKYYYNFEENSSDTETSSESDKSIQYKGSKLFHHNSPSKTTDKYNNKTDIFQQYTLLSQQEATQQHQTQEKKRQYSKQRNRPDYIHHKNKYDRINIAATPPPSATATTTITSSITATNKNVDAAFSPVKPQNANYIENQNSTSPRSIKDLNNFDDISNKFDKIAAKQQQSSTIINGDNENHLIANSPSSQHHQQHQSHPLVVDNFQGSNISLSNNLSSSVYHSQHQHQHQSHHHQHQHHQNQSTLSSSVTTTTTTNNIPNNNISMPNNMIGITSLTRGTPPLPDFRVDIFLEPLNKKQQQQIKDHHNQQQQQESSLSTILTSNKQQQQNNIQNQQQELHDNLDECQKLSQNTGAINVTPNPMEVAVCTQPRATIVVQQPSLSLDNTVETMLLKDEGEFESVEKARKSKHHIRDESNMRQLLDVTNTLTFEELRDFEMRYGSPHHCRSQSVKTPRASGRPNQLSLPQQRSRVASMPNTGVEEEYYRLRHFSITGKGIVNRGDSLKSRRSRSNNSVRSNNSSNSSTEHLTATVQPVCGGSARTSATCSLASSRESSTSNPGGGPYKVLMLGGPAVGKTSLISQFMTSEYLHAYDTSIDDESGEKSVNVLLNGEESELTFTDLPSTEISPENCLSSYDPHGYCIIYSSADRDSFNIAEMILQALWTSENIAQKAVILVGNKADLARSRTVTSEEGKSMATAYDCKFIETSVGINHNVDELLVGLLSQIRLKLENPEKSRDLFRKRSSRRNKRACSPLGVPCLSGGNNPSNPGSPVGPNPNLPDGTPPRSVQSSPRKYRGSRTSASLKVKGLLGRVWARDSKSKSCENLHVL